MNTIFYIIAIIILLLIITFISLKYYLSKKYVIALNIDDNTVIENECFYTHNVNLIYCKYIVNHKKYNVISNIQNMIKNSNGQKLTFNAIDFDLPPNGILKIGFVCYICKSKKKDKFINLAGIGGDSISIPNKKSYNGKYYTTNQLQNIYDDKTGYYDLTQYVPPNEQLRNGTNIIPIHSSSTQNPVFWNNNPNFSPNTNNHEADLKSMAKKINTAIENNNVDNLLNAVEVEENKQNPHYINDTPFSSYVNIFSRKYPPLSVTSVLGGYIDPEFMPDGLYNSAKLLDVITN